MKQETLSDLLSISIPLAGETYPSKNHEGKDNRRNGQKSESYTRMVRETKHAAEAEALRIYWQKAQCACLFIVTLIVPNYRRRDALNLGTAEANALTEAGIWADDTLANPVIKQVVVDLGAPARVVLCVQKLHSPLLQPLQTLKTPKIPIHKPSIQPKEPAVVKIERPIDRSFNGIDIPRNQALVNGKLVPLAQAQALLEKYRKQ